MFENDFDSYVLCRYNTKNLIDTQTAYYISIKDIFEYVVSVCKQNKDEFIKKYLSHQSGCIFNFEYEQNIYELYKIEKNSAYVLIIFDLETDLINSVKGFGDEESALKNMKKQLKNTSKKKNRELQKNFEQNVIHLNNKKIFGMVSKCAKRLCDMTQEEILTEIENKFCDINLDDVIIEPKNKNQLLCENGTYFRKITAHYKFKYYNNIYCINVEAYQYFSEEKTIIEIDCDESFLRETRLTDMDVINCVGDIIEKQINEL